jgi:N-acyl-D-amino-acid deacylase
MSSNYDLLIDNALVVDGSGAPAFRGAIGVVGERIAAVGQLRGTARRAIDAGGGVVCPGFIDPHSHADSSILTCPTANNLVMQGVTTFVGGNCGQSLAPVADPNRFRETLSKWGIELEVEWRTFGEWLSAVEREALSLNMAPLVGHNTVREAVMGHDRMRPALPFEVDRMESHLREAMESGAYGLSAGFDAAWSGHFADVSEVVALAKVVLEYGGLFAPHTRHHQNQWPADSPNDVGYGVYHGPTGEIITGRYHGLLEAVEIAKLAGGVRLQIAHLTPAYIIPQPHPALLDEAAARATLIDIVDRASDAGLDVTFSVIPWAQTVGRRVPIANAFLGPHAFLPGWLVGLEPSELAARLTETGFRERLRGLVTSGKFKFGMIHPLTDPYWMDCYTILECRLAGCSGRTLGEIVREREPNHVTRAVYDESLETLFDILAEDPDATWALTMDKREAGALPTFLRHPAAMPCSDVQAFAGTGEPSEALFGYGGAPIAYGLFPHYVKHFVRETGVLSLEEAIMKATSVPARRLLGLNDRGIIREGAYADLVVIDPETIGERGDFLNPALPPAGIHHVIVNGTPVWNGLSHTGSRPGRVLRRTQVR